MINFQLTSILWLMILMAIVAVIFALRAYLGYRRVQLDAGQDFDYKIERNMLPKGEDRDSYIRAYMLYYAPRYQLYIALAITALLLLTWPFMGLINAIYVEIWELMGRQKIYAPGNFVFFFILFFSMIFFWATIAFLAARRYYRLQPVSFEDARRSETRG